MLAVYPVNDPNILTNGYYIRPTPLISISQNVLRNKMGSMGSTYDITLNGTIVTKRLVKDDGKNPKDEYQDPIPTGVKLQEKLPEILAKQAELREHFTIGDAIYVEVFDIEANQPRMGFFAKVNSINFEEGIYVDTCRYTISLTADYLLTKKREMNANDVLDSGKCPSSKVPSEYRTDIINYLNSVSGMVEDFNDTWSIEVDETNGQFVAGRFVPRSYRITRNMVATGRDIYPRVKDSWEHARDFLKLFVESGKYSSTYEQIFTSGFLQMSGYQGYNHVRTESLDKGAGTYGVSDTWLLSSGDSALESYNLSIQSSRDNPYVKVSIDGNIRGLSPLPASGYLINSVVATTGFQNGPYENAIQKYHFITNSGQFGVNSDVYKRANNAISQNLNSQPNSFSVGTNEVNGEITYNLEFDNRPTNYFSGVLSESINVNDTYPGDVFAVIPVIGRSTGPVLQYIGGRTEYKRDINIEIQLDSTDIGYEHTRGSLMLTKPSTHEPLRSQLNQLIYDLGPASEPFIRKYFLNPPSESWSPKEGRYSLSLSWIYELNR